MKSTHNKSTQTDVKYPCLMTTEDGKVVLFFQHEVGTVVATIPGHQPVGYYSQAWGMSGFTPLSPNESVTLQND